ncbi:oxygenase MpaB family protein [Arthrobacter sp. NPDC055138]
MGCVGNILIRWRDELRGTFAGQSDTVPQWELELENGDDAGYFAPDSAVWTVHRSMTTLVAGIRSLLVQTLHPGALAGVDDFSAYRAAPLARLANTIRWIFTVTYGDTAAAKSACDLVLQLHERVRGSYTDSSGQQQPYYANDPHLLRWVHLTFTDAFVTSYLTYGRRLPGGPDQYVAEWAKAGELMQVTDPPRTFAELRRQLNSYRPELSASAAMQETVEFVRHPPLPRSQRLGYSILFAAAVETLPEDQRRLLGLRPRTPLPLRILIKPATWLVLGVVRLGLSKTGPSEAAARRRLARLHQQA